MEYDYTFLPLLFSFFVAQFQTMNIGTLGQPNVVTIQHQGRAHTLIVHGYLNFIL